MKRILVLTLLLGGCRADFHPYGNDSETEAGTDGADTGGDTGSSTTDDTGTTTTTDDTGSTSGTDETGSTGTDETGSTDETGGPEPESAAPDEPCDPFLGEDYGVDPCTDTYTCVYVQLMAMPNVWTVELRCAHLDDSQGDGSGLGDYCNDGGAPPHFPGCLDSFCMTNGHPDVYPLNFAQGDCSPGAAGEDRCCVPYCDDEHPCGIGEECGYYNGETGLGACLVP